MKRPKPASFRTLQRRAIVSTLAVVCLVFAGEAPGDETATLAAYEAAVTKAKTLRPTESEPVFDDPVPGREDTIKLKDGEFIQEMISRTYRSASTLSEMVLQDNSVGRVYPGSLLWTGPLMDGRLEPIVHLPGRPNTKVAIAGARIDPKKGNPGFEHDGSYLDFREKSATTIGAIVAPETRWSLDIQYGRSLESCLLKVGLSAKFWATKLSASHINRKTVEKSFAVVSLDQVYYSLVADTPTQQGLVPRAFLARSPAVTEYLGQAIEGNGEIGYVRRVSFGRRLIISLSSESSQQDLEYALRLSTSGPGYSVDGELDRRAKTVLSKTQARAVVVGGKIAPGLIDAVTGDFAKFLPNLNTYLKQTTGFTSDTSAIPVSFEVAYACDNAPFRNFETVEFSGQIPGRRYRPAGSVEASTRIRMSGADARLLREDWEVHSDDWTSVAVSYAFSVGRNKRTIILTVAMDVKERESNRAYRGKTHIQTKKSFEVYAVPADDGRTIAGLDGRPMTREDFFRGENHGWSRFGSGTLGCLRDLRVQFDGPSGNDRDRQNLSANVVFQVHLAEEK